jgi:hypothetical protein
METTGRKREGQRIRDEDKNRVLYKSSPDVKRLKQHYVLK